MALLNDVHTEGVNRCALACARHARDADASRVARVGETLLDDLLSDDLVLGIAALD